ncbi:restriction endonuclease subunit S [Aquaspirillum serpens]|uniref:restriction endonuclease subunit S n=1 Tax=Aquaspirillum serpens TaxID=190 RepID=UPI0003B3EBF0|nr:restriction endonuclease subunit S [Aquaspirillum serpens]
MRQKKLSELLDISIGRTPSRNEPSYWGKGYPWVSIRDLSSKIVTETKEQITDRAVTDARCKVVKKGTLLFSFKLTIGKMAFAGCDLFTNEAIAAFAIKDEKELHPEFLYYALQSATYGGSNQAVMGKTLNSKSLAEIEIPVPPLDDQIRIAHLLGKVEGLIAQRKQHLQQLDDLLKSVFLEMFGDPVRNEKGWEPTTIGESVEIQSGQVDPRELPYSEMLHVGGANIEAESGNFIELKQAKHENLISGKYLFDSTFILYSKIRPYLNKVAKPDFAGICSADIYPIRPIDGLLNRDFLRLLLLSKSFLNHAANNSDRANIPKINRKALVAFGFNRPPIDLQNELAVIVDKVEALKSRYQQSLTDLEALYGALSQQAFNGELDLSQVALPATSIEVR